MLHHLASHDRGEEVVECLSVRHSTPRVQDSHEINEPGVVGGEGGDEDRR